MIRLPLLAAAALSLAACTATTPPPAAAGTAQTAEQPPVTILVSIDAFRPDYLDRGVTPNLNALKADGAFAVMRPSFPSKTFPNHWAMVTGDDPDHSGIVANRMVDPDRPGDTFTMATDDPFWWNAAEPIWVAAEKAGIRTATMFWPGANVAWGGIEADDAHHTITGGTRPEDWQQYSMAVTGGQRVDAVIDWLRRPPATRPKFVTLYFDTVDTAGHEYGPADAHVTQAVAGVDRDIGRLVAGLRTLRQPANIVIVSDHGMAAIDTSREIVLDRVADPADYTVVEDGPYAALDPVAGHEAALAAALLRPHDHMTCWRKADVPARFHYGTNRRIPPFFCLADTGWMIEQHAKPLSGGDHGWDNLSPDMAATFIASGPAFRTGVMLPPFINVDIDPLLRDLIGLPPTTGIDGTDAPFAPALKHG